MSRAGGAGRRGLRATALLCALAAVMPVAAQWERSGGWRDAGPRGVTLFEHEDYRGRSEFFAADDPRLTDNPIGNDRASSIQVDRGCRVTLYRDDRFRGLAEVLDDDEPSLAATRVGNDSVSSLSVRCEDAGGLPYRRRDSDERRPGYRPGYQPDYRGDRGGVELFVHSGFRGHSEVFEGDVADLGYSDIGNDEASSVRIARGCRAILYADVNFRGAAIRVDGDIEHLGRTPIGNDEVSSLEVRCRWRDHDREPDHRGRDRDRGY